MAKYKKLNAFQRSNAKKSGVITVDELLTPDETVIWKGKPKKSAFVLRQIMSRLFIFFFILFLTTVFTVTLVKAAYTGYTTNNLPLLITFIPLMAGTAFAAVLVICQFISIAGSAKIWEHTEYAITDKRIIINSGFISLEYKSIFYKNIRDMQYSRDIIDRIYKTGDIFISCVNSEKSTQQGSSYAETKPLPQFSILDIPDHKELYDILKKVIIDIQSDIEFPNAYRPEENSGYKATLKS